MLRRSIRKGLLENRQYRGIVLPNSLRCVLVSDPSTPLSSASMNVSVGSMDDPIHFQGLAHFLEHMLFLGTNKYPRDNHYKTLISDNGGTCNAYTGLFDTNYYFQVKSEKMAEVLDVFGQFFISPLFNDDCTRREINAVDSEASKNIIIDSRRIYHLRRHLSAADSPFNKYSTGNLKTLDKPGLRDALISFHRDNYSADRMSLVFYHNQSLEVMESTVKDIFSPIEDKRTRGQSYKECPPVYAKGAMGTITRVIPMQDRDTLSIIFTIPEAYTRRLSKPLSYLTHILGHECAGSIADTLISKGYALGVNAGYDHTLDYFTNVELKISLTETGLQNIDAILETVGDYLHLLRQTPPQSWIYEEIRKMAELRFNYRSNSSPSDTAVEIAAALRDYDFEDVLSGGYTYKSFDADYIKQTTDMLNENNVQVYLSSKKIPADQCSSTEPIYGTKYSVTTMTDRQKELLRGKQNPELRLPHPNACLPSSPVLLTSPSDGIIAEKLSVQPTKLIDEEMSSLWFLFDCSFKLPKVHFYATIYDNTKDHYNNPMERIYYSLWSTVFDFVFRSEKYELSLAGAHSSLNSCRQGLSLSMVSFSQSLLPSLQAVLSALERTQSYSNRSQFEQILVKFKNSYRNQLLSQPYETANELLSEVMIDPNYTLEQALEFLDSISWSKFCDFRSRLMKDKVYLEVGVMGNISESDARLAHKFLVSSITNLFSPSTSLHVPTDYHKSIITRVPTDKKLVVQHTVHLPTEKNSALVTYFQVGENKRERAALAVLSNYLKFKYFYDLRTQQQLGYIVHCGLSKYNDVYGFKFLVQSSHKHPEYLSKKTRDFLSTTAQRIQSLTREELAGLVSGLSSNYLRPFDSLSDLTSFLWAQIIDREYEFDRHHNVLNELNGVTTKDVVGLFNRVFVTDGRTVEVHAVCAEQKKAYLEEMSKRLDEDTRVHVCKNSEIAKRKLTGPTNEKL